MYHFWEIATVSLAILRDDKTSRNGVWLDVKIMCKNAGFRARIYYLYIKSVDIADFFCYITFRAA